MSAAKRRLLIPEVIQTSAMDCGPAALKAMLEGFGPKTPKPLKFIIIEVK